jgi:hypothetical protein
MASTFWILSSSCLMCFWVLRWGRDHWCVCTLWGMRWMRLFILFFLVPFHLLICHWCLFRRVRSSSSSLWVGSLWVPRHGVVMAACWALLGDLHLNSRDVSLRRGWHDAWTLSGWGYWWHVNYYYNNNELQCLLMTLEQETSVLLCGMKQLVDFRFDGVEFELQYYNYIITLVCTFSTLLILRTNCCFSSSICFNFFSSWD